MENSTDMDPGLDVTKTDASSSESIITNTEENGPNTMQVSENKEPGLDVTKTDAFANESVITDTDRKPPMHVETSNPTTTTSCEERSEGMTRKDTFVDSKGTMVDTEKEDNITMTRIKKTESAASGDEKMSTEIKGKAFPSDKGTLKDLNGHTSSSSENETLGDIKRRIGSGMMCKTYERHASDHVSAKVKKKKKNKTEQVQSKDAFKESTGNDKHKMEPANDKKGDISNEKGVNMNKNEKDMEDKHESKFNLEISQFGKKNGSDLSTDSELPDSNIKKKKKKKKKTEQVPSKDAFKEPTGNDKHKMEQNIDKKCDTSKHSGVNMNKNEEDMDDKHGSKDKLESKQCGKENDSDLSTDSEIPDSDDSVNDPTFRVKDKDLNCPSSSSGADTTGTKSPLKRQIRHKKVPKRKFNKRDSTHISGEMETKLPRKKADSDDRSFTQDHKEADITAANKPSKRKLFKSTPTKATITGRNKGWKRKPTSLNKNQKKCPGTPYASFRRSVKSVSKKFPTSSKHDNDMEWAIKESAVAFRAKQVILSYHSRTLDALLASNGLKRKPVLGNGNCFFAAVDVSANLNMEVDKLRDSVCKLMTSNMEEYFEFLSSPNSEKNEIVDKYLKELDILSKNGSWSVDLGDAVPLAMANTLGREIAIFNSRRDNPITRIQPKRKSQELAINVAFLAIPGYEHYDAVEIAQNTPIKDKAHTAAASTPKSRTPCKDSASTDAAPETLKRKQQTEESPFVSPRKQARYISPKKKLRYRKRKQNPSAWKKNIRKNLRLAGKEYTSATGKIIKASVHFVDCTKCRFKCTEIITENERRKAFGIYWSLGSYERQRDFICSHVMEGVPDRKRTSAKKSRTTSRQFFFNLDGHNVRVCKSFFVKTLDIGDRCTETALKSRRGGTYGSTDKPGRHAPHNATPKTQLQSVRDHIESFPVVDPHYTRQDTHRKFLGNDLNISKMYSLYVEECKSKVTKPVGKSVYRNIFCNEYNFSFHVPKKDQCQTCTLYQQATENDDITKEYNEHQQRKTKAREEKNTDKAFAKENERFHAATFDLQAVLPVPCSLVSQVYYKRKLSCFNLSVYSLGDGTASCFLWDETEGKRGSHVCYYI